MCVNPNIMLVKVALCYPHYCARTTVSQHLLQVSCYSGVLISPAFTSSKKPAKLQAVTKVYMSDHCFIILKGDESVPPKE